MDINYDDKMVLDPKNDVVFQKIFGSPENEDILIFNYIDSKKYHTTYHLWEDDEKTKLTDILEIHFIELPKYLEEQPELNNSLNKWLAFLTKPENEIMEVVEMGEPEIKKAITVLDMLSRDPETVRLAELRMKKILDEKSMIEGAKEEGKIEGKIAGKEEDALSFLKLGVSEEIVAEGTGLSVDRIREIKANLKDDIQNY